MALVTDGVAGPALEQLVHLQRNQFVTPALPNVPVHTLCMGSDRRRLCQQCPRSDTAQMREQEGTCFSVGRPPSLDFFSRRFSANCWRDVCADFLCLLSNFHRMN